MDNSINTTDYDEVTIIDTIKNDNSDNSGDNYCEDSHYILKDGTKVSEIKVSVKNLTGNFKLIVTE